MIPALKMGKREFIRILKKRKRREEKRKEKEGRGTKKAGNRLGITEIQLVRICGTNGPKPM